MNLDDLDRFAQIDQHHMIDHINRLPEQLRAAYELGLRLPLESCDGITLILIAGMGGSAIGADLLAAYAAQHCPLPVIVHRDYGLPAWARDPQTLVICCSHSGQTEETLSAFDEAINRGCRVLALTTGGRLEEEARRNGATVWEFAHEGQPRAAVGWSFGLLLALFARQGWVSDPLTDLNEAVEAMQGQQAAFLPEVPVVRNPAKRMAGQLMGRFVVIFAAGAFAPVARRWKGQINELAKACAQFEPLPEADHNTLAGLNNPESAVSQTIALFLRAESNHPRDLLRLEYTREIYMMQAVNTDFIEARGEGQLAQMWTLLHYGDYVGYYLAMAYGEDPTPVEALVALKEAMNQQNPMS